MPEASPGFLITNQPEQTEARPLRFHLVMLYQVLANCVLTMGSDSRQYHTTSFLSFDLFRVQHSSQFRPCPLASTSTYIYIFYRSDLWNLIAVERDKQSCRPNPITRPSTSQTSDSGTSCSTAKNSRSQRIRVRALRSMLSDRC
jgi:hypothetical protein